MNSEPGFWPWFEIVCVSFAYKKKYTESLLWDSPLYVENAIENTAVLGLSREK